MFRKVFSSFVICSLLAAIVPAAPLQTGPVQLTSGGPLTFGPDGILFVADPLAAAIYAIDSKDTAKSEFKPVEIKNIRSKIASMLGTESDDVRVNDLAVNQKNGNAYLSVTRGSGSAAGTLILKVNTDGEISEFALDNVQWSKATLNNAPESRETRRGDPRMEAITDLDFVDGSLVIAGLSNEEFASKLHTIAFPFDGTDEGTSIDIYHGSHGKWETRSPVRTFAALEIEGQAHLLAAYTCTPLVTIPVADLKDGAKVQGVTVAELGNRNRPLDMVVYEKDGKNYVLMANSSRGVMKVDTQNVAEVDGITSRVPDTAGLKYETLKDLTGVVQLDRFGAHQAMILVESDKEYHLRVIDLP